MNGTNRPTVDDAFLGEVVRRILTVGRPLKVVLFGSHARGEAGPDSDLDLLIVEERSDVPVHKRATPYRMALTGIHPRKDIVVYTPAEIQDWAQVALAFVSTVLREGRVLYERPR